VVYSLSLYYALPIYSAVFLAQAGAQVPLAGRLSAELFARALWDHTGAIVDGYAAELVYSLTDDIALSIGTSTLGVKDPDLYLVRSEEHTSELQSREN